METAFEQTLNEALTALKISLPPGGVSLCRRHFERLIEANRHFNLTRITDPADAALKHYADSLALLNAPWIGRDAPLRVLDVGTGAGFPAFPLATACPAWQVTAIDGTAKKVRFVAEAASELGVTNLRAEHVRGEDLARISSARYDLITLRAVTDLADGLKKLHALLKPGGRIVYNKTSQIDLKERSEGETAARALGLAILEPFELKLAYNNEMLGRLLLAYGQFSRS